MRIYIARSGDTLSSVAARFHTDAETLWRLNGLKDPSRTAPGMALLLPSQDWPEHTTELFAFTSPDISEKLLSDALPSLSYLSTYSCRVSGNGNIHALCDGALTEKAVDSGVMPVMTLTNTDENGSFSPDAMHDLLQSSDAQSLFFENLFLLLALRHYRAVNFDFERVYSFDAEAYKGFLITAAAALHARGYFLFTTPERTDEGGAEGLFSAAVDLRIHGQCADRVLLLPAEDPEALIHRALYSVPSGKLLLGFDNGRNELSDDTAMELAAVSGACVHYDSGSSLSHFTAGGRSVYFHDARGLKSQLELVKRYKLAGMAVLCLNRPFSQCFNALKADVNIEKFM